MTDLLVHMTFGDIISDEMLGDLVTRKLFAEGKVGCMITKVTIAAVMNGVESRGDIVLARIAIEFSGRIQQEGAP